MGDNSRINPIRPGTPTAPSDRGHDEVDDDFDERTVVDRGLYSRSLDAGLDEPMDAFEPPPGVRDWTAPDGAPQATVPPGQTQAQYQTPPAMVHPPAAGQMHTPMPAMYQTPVPGQMYTPVPPYQNPIPVLVTRPKTALLLTISAVVLLLAGIGLGSILFSNEGVAEQPAVAQVEALVVPADAAQEPKPVPVEAMPKPEPVSEVPEPEPVAMPVAEEPEPAEPDVNLPAVVEMPVPASEAHAKTRSIVTIKSPMDGIVAQVFLRNEQNVRRGAKLFVISGTSGVSGTRRKELSRAVEEAERMVKEDPELYGPFLAKAKRALASATMTKNQTITAKRSGIGVPRVKEGEVVRRGQILAKIE